MPMNLPTFALWLVFSPAEITYEQSLTDLDTAAQSIAVVSPVEAITKLEQSLATVAQYPEDLLHDSTVVDKIARARLALVWAFVAEGDIEAATTVMDDAIRSSGGRELPLAGLGPDVRKFSEARRQHLEAAGTATIKVDCDGCQVLVNEVSSENPTSPLLLGDYRVWVFDPEGDLEPMSSEVVLETEGQTVTLVFRTPRSKLVEATPRPIFEPERRALKPDERPALKPDERLAFEPKVPRWAKVVGIAVGAGLVVTGGVLLSLDGKCKNGDVATPENVSTTCQDVWTTKGPGFALVGIGGGLFMGATVWLTVDEVRAGRSRRANAMIAWTVRF